MHGHERGRQMLKYVLEPDAWIGLPGDERPLERGKREPCEVKEEEVAFVVVGEPKIEKAFDRVVGRFAMTAKRAFDPITHYA